MASKYHYPGYRYMVCLGGGVEGSEIIKRVAARKLIPIIVDENSRCPARRGIHNNFRQVKINPYHSGNVWALFNNWLNSSRSIAGIISCATDTPDVQAYVATKLNLPTVGEGAARLAVNKQLQYEVLLKNGIPVPLTLPITPDTPYDKAFDVVKPIRGRGSRGVVRYANEREFEYAKTTAISNFNDYHVLVQKWIDGVQLSTESIIRNGEIEFTAVAERNYGRLNDLYPHVIEDGSDAPHGLNVRQKYNLDKLILRAAMALGWDNTTVKCDIVFNKDMFYIIEMTPRLSGGFFCTHIIPLAYNVNMADIAIDFAIGRGRRAISPIQRRFVCQRFVFPRQEWYGKKIVDLPSPIDKNAEVGLFTVYKKIGDTVESVKKHSDRLAQCIALGKTPLEARERCERIVHVAEDQFIVE